MDELSPPPPKSPASTRNDAFNLVGGHMRRAFLVFAFAIVIGNPAFAATACSTAPASQFKPKTELETQLKAQGLTVRKIKTEGGCYEVYAVDKAGKKVNAAFNAQTLDKVDNAEAGEQ
jgi:hypothetical protein